MARSPLRSIGRSAAAACLAFTAGSFLPGGAAGETLQIKVLGGLAGVSQYTRFEEPFWRDGLTALSGGRIKATIHPFDRSGLRSEGMLQLMRLGVVPFGTALMAVASAEEPELNAVDLPGLNPDIASLRANVGLYRDRVRQILDERYGIELLGIYAYPAQVIYCAQPFGGLDDLSGRRVRTSSVSQSEMVAALGGVPVVTAFTETVNAISTGVVDCAITGTLSGNEIGLSEVTSHIHAMAVSWGLSIFGANRAAWNAVPEDLRTVIRSGVADLERNIWEAADRETESGLACNTGAASCVTGRRGHMTLVPVSTADETRRKRLLTDLVIPRWIQRCGDECAQTWNRVFAPVLGIKAGPS